jgi:hypothetical protein
LTDGYRCTAFRYSLLHVTPPTHRGCTSTHGSVLYATKMARNDPVIPHSQKTMYRWNRWIRPLYCHCFWVIVRGNNYIARRGMIFLLL